MELHDSDAQRLKQEFRGDTQVVTHHYDGYQGIKAFLPPKERRGLVLIDSPFEQKDEFDRIVDALDTAWQRWPTGIYAAWYPLVGGRQVAAFHQMLRTRQWEEIID